MDKEDPVYDQELFCTIVHAIGDWLDEKHLDLKSDSYFRLASHFYDHLSRDVAPRSGEFATQLRELFDQQFELRDSRFEVERQANIKIFQRFSHIAAIAAAAILIGLFLASVHGAATVARGAAGVLLISAIVSFVVIPMLRRLPRHKTLKRLARP